MSEVNLAARFQRWNVVFRDIANGGTLTDQRTAELLTAVKGTRYEARTLEALSSNVDNRPERLADIFTDMAAEIRADQEPRAAETRAIHERAARLTGAGHDGRDMRGVVPTGDNGEWRGLLPSLSEYRNALTVGSSADGGITVPTAVSTQWVDKLRAKSVVLRAGVQVIPFSEGFFKLPQLTGTNTPGVVAEATAITPGDTDWAGLSFTPLGYKDLQSASNEILADSALPLRTILANTMIKNIASKVDNDAINGSGTGALKGLLASGNNTKTALAAGTAINWDAMYDAYAAIEGTGAEPSVILASPDAAAALRKAKASTAGTYLMGEVADASPNTAMGLPLLVSGNLPAKSAIVMAADRVYFGQRQDVIVRVSEDYLFNQDMVAFRATFRAAGLAVAEATSVQWVLGG